MRHLVKLDIYGITPHFRNTVFSVSDRVAMGLLLRIKAVQRETAVKNLKRFVEGSEEDRLKVLTDTFNLNKRR